MNSVPSPIAASSSGSASRTACETATVLPAGDFVIAMVSDGSPLTREIPVTGSSTSSTVAMSAIVVAASPPSKGSAATSSADSMRAPACTVRVWPSSVI